MVWLAARITPLKITSWRRPALAALVTVSVIVASSLSAATNTDLLVIVPLAIRIGPKLTPALAFGWRRILITMGVSLSCLTSTTLPAGTSAASVNAAGGMTARKSRLVGRMWV